MNSIEAIGRRFRDGEIGREDYWLRMQEWHVALRQYQSLIEGGEVEAIEIVADGLRVRTRAGVRMIWHPEDLRTAPNVLVNTGRYEPVESAALMRAAAGAGVIFDIGANVGYFSLHWAAHLAAGGRIHCFEPVPETYERLTRNIALNGLEAAIVANNLGLGDRPGTVTIYLPSFSGSGAASIRDLHPEEGSAEIEARIDTLDLYFGRAGLDRLDLVKVDVEGAELMVLKGGLHTIRAHKPILFLELLRKWSRPFGYHPNEVIATLRELGYRCFAQEGDGLSEFGDMTDETVQTNFFFAHPERHGRWIAANSRA